MTTAGFGRELLATAAAAGLARTYVDVQLRKLGCAEAVHDAQLVATELVANAIAECRWGGTIRIFLGQRPRGLVFGVWDPGPRMPRRGPMPELTLGTLDLDPAGFDRNGGRGLAVVAALTRDLWVERSRPGGKWVCALLDVTARPEPRPVDVHGSEI
ncbi:ATP-binding protein [Thermomonospora cellulosilytica]|uniref:Anti-sigma regulatory factor (Ser/Thr protein kinase) n=1 Tax=Thermomonospora cellulosilytica TaxID=1411118 RepID=A0A7W3N5J0_9ACTN|nr:ATP-binding protein [Thermomonospora cellulosilytica]MBA9007929.1 anti-sigma regulatory factor (Ser/Thr protein kinase) [Thermomonospora cellulosilytica]